MAENQTILSFNPFVYETTNKETSEEFMYAVGIILLSAVDPLAGYAAERTIDIKHLGEGQSIVRVDARAKYLLLPVEESSPNPSCI